MNLFHKHLTSLLLCIVVSATAFAQEKIILLNEGIWQSDNGRATYFENGRIVSNQWFRDVNGTKLGDTPTDIIHVRPNLIAIAINWSNIIQFIDAGGHRVAETEDIPNNRKLATDGDFVYVSSYGHECMTTSGMKSFTKGFVAKIDVGSFKVVDAVEVGYEPEGIAYYNGKLFVANTGGYAFQENHDYEKTVSVIDAATMKLERNIDTGQINLYGNMSQAGQYLCINSPGDYYSVSAATVILDCEASLSGKTDRECFRKLAYASTYSTPDTQGNFYAVGSMYSYLTGEYTFNYITINPAEVMSSDGSAGVYCQMPGSVVDDLKKMATPYGIYVNPFTGYIYATDAAGYAEGGIMYQWSPQGDLLGKYGVYINPAHFLALDPLGEESGIWDIEHEACGDRSGMMYNLQGMPVLNPRHGEIYIRNGKKIYL